MTVIPAKSAKKLQKSTVKTAKRPQMRKWRNLFVGLFWEVPVGIAKMYLEAVADAFHELMEDK